LRNKEYSFPGRGGNFLYVYYNVAGIYFDAGQHFTNNIERSITGRCITSPGMARPILPTIGSIKVRDRYETFIDTATLQPLKFFRNVNEGGYKKYENITFNRNANTAVTTEGVF